MDTFYVDLIASEIEKSGYKRIAIQSADLSVGSQFCHAIQARFRSSTERPEFYVLGDVFIDFVVHIGVSCHSVMDPPMPVRRVFDRSAADGGKLCLYLRDVLAACSYTRLILVYDSSMHHLVDAFEECLNSSGKLSFIAECVERSGGNSDRPESDDYFCGRRLFVCTADGQRTQASSVEASVGDSETLVLYVADGPDRDVTTDYLALSSVGSQFHVITVDSNEFSHRVIDERGHRLRMRRYQKVEKVREASTVGILVIARTLRGSSALRHSLSQLLESHGKRCYTFSVNCLTEAKLANFPNIDVFCLLSCGESVLSLPEELARRVVLPFEVLVALERIEWSAPYEFDFARLLPHAQVEEADALPASGGEIRRLRGNFELRTQVESFMGTLQDNSKRTFGGVDPLHGMSDQVTVVSGFHGTASGYEHERRV
ncbi:Diphthamide biosynthesis protein [Babesia bigemina]|uniref:Diphthamide biosynthesis protein n=1 Tax=Babesia bigemina TaxID=5866 RepID=A0A061D6F3_BABBI|nr:Diphthamide biosynthesis protein [Babesia bigemina]CDR94514.1 Diphthamide biosynthesis protein [Babesia bigemina]|eukprot:XP_012766700.1 Diphthamide biosynthesis protein [Babesia bigemina]